MRLWASIVGIPLLVLFAIDRAIVWYQPHWQWVAKEIPRQTYDPYRVEAQLRTIEPGRHNVLILGDSTSEASIDPKQLDRRFADQGLEFTILSIGGAPTVSFGLLANAVAALDPAAVVVFVSPYTLRSRGIYPHIHTYDARTVPALFTLEEILDHLPFHLSGLAGQAHVLVRHRRPMRHMAAIYLGLDDWSGYASERIQRKLKMLRNKIDSPLMTWMRDQAKAPDVYPNPNTRALELLARRLAGDRLVVVEASIHPLFGLLLRPQRLTAFRRTVEQIAAEQPLVFLDAATMPVLEEADFEDHSHLNARGRRRFTEALANHLEKVLARSPDQTL